MAASLWCGDNQFLDKCVDPQPIHMQWGIGEGGLVIAIGYRTNVPSSAMSYGHMLYTTIPGLLAILSCAFLGSNARWFGRET